METNNTDTNIQTQSLRLAASPLSRATAFEASVSGARGRALFIVAAGVFLGFISFMAGRERWPTILPSPLSDPIGCASTFLVPLFAVYLLYAGFNFLYQKLTIRNGLLTTREILRTKTVSLVDLTSIQSRIKYIRSRYGVQYKTYLDITDHDGRKLSVQVHYYKDEAVLAQILLSAVSDSQLTVNATTQRTLDEIAGSAQSSAFTPVTDADRMMVIELKQVLIVAAIVMPLLVAFVAYRVRHQSATPPVNTSATSRVADEFMHDLGEGQITKAKSLESPHMQSDAKQSKYLLTTDFAGLEKSKRVDQYIGSIQSKSYVAYVYRYDGYGKPYYVKIALSEYGSDWRVWFFETSYSPLYAKSK